MLYVILAVILIIIVWSSIQVERLDQPDELSRYLGYWIWFSDDGLRKEVININYGGDNRFLNVTRTTTIRKWFPPVHPGDPALVTPPAISTEHAPMYRVLRLSSTEILLDSVEPTYAELPFHVKLIDGGTHIEVFKKKYISSNNLDLSTLKF